MNIHRLYFKGWYEFWVKKEPCCHKYILLVYYRIDTHRVIEVAAEGIAMKFMYMHYDDFLLQVHFSDFWQVEIELC